MARRKPNKPRRNPPKKKKNRPAGNQAAPAPPAPPVVNANSEAENQQQQPQDSSDPPTEQQQPEKPIWAFDRKTWGRAAIFVELLFAGAVAYFAYVQAEVTEGQLEVMRKGIAQTDTIIEQMQLDTRAWLVVTDRPSIAGVEEGRIDVDIPLKNVGKSDATIKYSTTRVVLDRGGDELINAWRHPEFTHPGYEVLIPDEVIRAFGRKEVGVIDRTISDPEQIKAISDRKANLFVIGIALYDDKYGQLRLTRWCYRYDPSTKELHEWYLYNEAE